MVAVEYIHVQLIQDLVFLLGVCIQNRICGVCAADCTGVLLPEALRCCLQSWYAHIFAIILCWCILHSSRRDDLKKKDTRKDTNGHFQCVLTLKRTLIEHLRPRTNMHSTIWLLYFFIFFFKKNMDHTTQRGWCWLTPALPVTVGSFQCPVGSDGSGAFASPYSSLADVLSVDSLLLNYPFCPIDLSYNEDRLGWPHATLFCWLLTFLLFFFLFIYLMDFFLN